MSKFLIILRGTVDELKIHYKTSSENWSKVYPESQVLPWITNQSEEPDVEMIRTEFNTTQAFWSKRPQVNEESIVNFLNKFEEFNYALIIPVYGSPGYEIDLSIFTARINVWNNQYYFVDADKNVAIFKYSDQPLVYLINKTGEDLIAELPDTFVRTDGIRKIINSRPGNNEDKIILKDKVRELFQDNPVSVYLG